jgi:uncharacterized protein YciI
MKITATALLILSSIWGVAQEQKYTIIFLNKNTEAQTLTKEESQKIMEGHMANINAMAKAGRLVAAGPFEGGGGLFIMNTTSIDSINKWIAPDPGVQAKRWKIEMLPYFPKHGGVCAVREPYEMIMYSFARFDAVRSKSTAGTYPQIIKLHEEQIKQLSTTGNLITSASFGDNEGGIVVMKGEVDRAVFEADPGVQQGLLELTFKKLYIAKGAFCEK